MYGGGYGGSYGGGLHRGRPRHPGRLRDMPSVAAEFARQPQPPQQRPSYYRAPSALYYAPPTPEESPEEACEEAAEDDEVAFYASDEFFVEDFWRMFRIRTTVTTKSGGSGGGAPVPTEAAFRESILGDDEGLLPPGFFCSDQNLANDYAYAALLRHQEYRSAAFGIVDEAEAGAEFGHLEQFIFTGSPSVAKVAAAAGLSACDYDLVEETRAGRPIPVGVAAALPCIHVHANHNKLEMRLCELIRVEGSLLASPVCGAAGGHDAWNRQAAAAGIMPAVTAHISDSPSKRTLPIRPLIVRTEETIAKHGPSHGELERAFLVIHYVAPDEEHPEEYLTLILLSPVLRDEDPSSTMVGDRLAIVKVTVSMVMAKEKRFDVACRAKLSAPIVNPLAFYFSPHERWIRSYVDEDAEAERRAPRLCWWKTINDEAQAARKAARKKGSVRR